MINKPFEQISPGEKGISESRVITDDYIRSFADLTWDRHPLHLDDDYAASTRFGGRIAHGALIISTLLGLVELHPSYLQCFYGINNLKFKAPTYVGDELHVETEILSVEPNASETSAVVASQARVINQDRTEVLIGDFFMLVAGHATALSDWAAA